MKYDGFHFLKMFVCHLKKEKTRIFTEKSTCPRVFLSGTMARCLRVQEVDGGKGWEVDGTIQQKGTRSFFGYILEV